MTLELRHIKILIMTNKRKDILFIAMLTLGVCETVQGDKLEDMFKNSILNLKEFMLEWVSSTHFLIYFFMPCLSFWVTINSQTVAHLVRKHSPGFTNCLWFSHFVKAHKISAHLDNFYFLEPMLQTEFKFN